MNYYNLIDIYKELDKNKLSTFSIFPILFKKEKNYWTTLIKLIFLKEFIIQKFYVIINHMQYLSQSS